MPFIFISYSHKDSEYANRLADSLEAHGLNVWIDERIDYGARWPQAIQENLDKCAAFVVLMTPNSFKSQWVQNELARAQRLGKPTYPLLLDGDVWLALEATEYVDVRGAKLLPSDFFARLASTLVTNQAQIPMVSGQRERLQVELGELQGRYDNLTNRIKAVDTELYRVMDGEHRVTLEERRVDLTASRKKTAAFMEEIEKQLAQPEKGERDVQPALKPQVTSAQIAVASIENKSEPQDQVSLPKEFVHLPQAHERNRTKANRPLLVVLGAVVVATLAIIAYAAGIVPTTHSPAPTVSLAGEQEDKPAVELLVGSSNLAPTFLVKPTRAATPTRTATDTPSSTLGLNATTVQLTSALAATYTSVPITTSVLGAVILAGDRMTLTSPVEMELVQVPAGEFLMGNDQNKELETAADEQPQHLVNLAVFYIGKYEVRNDQYAAFVEATGRTAPDLWENGKVPSGREDHPVMNVLWGDALAFTEWLSEETGRTFRLCTEAEWEKACRGPTGIDYPWADAFDADKANTLESGIGTTTSVGAYSPAGDSFYGVSDMSGNVWEWVADWYAEDYYETSPVDNPQGPATGEDRALRGGSYLSPLGIARCAYRVYYSYHRNDINGFRICASP